MHSYPNFKKVNTIDCYHDVPIEDPYCWLEDAQQDDTRQWIAAENQITRSYFDAWPFREKIRERLQAIWNYSRYSPPFKAGAYTYFYKNDGLQQQSVLYRQGSDGTEIVFLDPNTLSADGATSVAGVDFTRDGSLAACQVSAGGADLQRILVIDGANGRPTGEMIDDVSFSFVAWRGNEGFYYSSYRVLSTAPQPDQRCHHLYFHRLGTAQETDELVFGGAHTPRRFIMAYLTEDERFLVIGAAMSPNGNELYIKDLRQEGCPLKCVTDKFDYNVSVLCNDGDRLLLHTNLGAPNFRVVSANAADPAPGSWQELVPETPHVLQASMAGGTIFCKYLKDAISLVKQYNMEGRLLHEVQLPGTGTATGFGGRSGAQETYYVFASYIHPPVIYRYNISTGISEIYKKSGISFDPDRYISKQVFYHSQDGTAIPMIITCRRDLELNGKNPTLLTAYGGFGVSIKPEFITSNIVLLEKGGVYAVPNLRGGGEYGRSWHEAGVGLNKLNVINDFVAAAQYLCREGYTSSDYLAIAGASNGGLLVGATITRHPDICRVAFADVGVLDMLRYNKFAAGKAWTYEYGEPEASREMFEYLLGYSPYHNIKRVSYPATLITTGERDDRVVPAHSFKFAARLQEHQQGSAPVLINIYENTGHGAGKSVSQQINEQTDKWTFLFANMGLTY